MDLDRIEGHDVGVDGLLQDGACIGGGGCHPGRGALVLTARGGVAVGGAHDDQIPEPWVHGPARLRGAQRGRGLGSERCVEPGAMTQTASKRRRQGIREGMESRGKRGKGRVPWAGSCLREPGGGRLADAGAACCQVDRCNGAREAGEAGDARSRSRSARQGRVRDSLSTVRRTDQVRGAEESGLGSGESSQREPAGDWSLVLGFTRATAPAPLFPLRPAADGSRLSDSEKKRVQGTNSG